MHMLEKRQVCERDINSHMSVIENEFGPLSKAMTS